MKVKMNQRKGDYKSRISKQKLEEVQEKNDDKGLNEIQ